MNARRHREPSRRRDAPRSTDPRPHANANPTVSTARLREARFRQVGGAAAAAARAASAPPGGGGTNRSRPAAAPAASQRAWDEVMRRLPASGTLKVRPYMHGSTCIVVHAWYMHGTCCGSCVPVARSRQAYYTSTATSASASAWLTTTCCLLLTSDCSLLTTHDKAGLLHLYLGDRWPPWTAHLLSSAAVSSGITFYFLGPPLDTHGCANCAWMPMDEAALDSRIVSHLGLPAGAVRLAPRPTTAANGASGGATGAAALPARKLCDLKPMWPALFPELSARHEWIGHADTDILWGNLSAEVVRLSLSLTLDLILDLSLDLTRALSLSLSLPLARRPSQRRMSC